MERGTEYEVEMAKNYLADQDIPSNILSKRDSSISVNVGEMALVYLYVPQEYEEDAKAALAEFELPEEGKGEEE
ncbi:MAG: putative signal transducing protein [Bacteroidota bacterium]